MSRDFPIVLKYSMARIRVMTRIGREIGFQVSAEATG